MIKIFYKTSKDKNLKTLEAFKKDSWIYIEDPSESELSFISGSYNLDEGLLRDAVDPNEVPRLEIEDKVIYIFTRFPIIDKGIISTTPFLIAIGSDYIVTVGHHIDNLLENFSSGKTGYYTTGKIRLLLKLMNTINSIYSFYLHDINKKVRSSAIKFEKIDNKDIIRFVQYENILNDFLSALIPNNAILHNLLSGKFLKFEEEYNDLVEDITLNTGEIIELSKSTLKVMVNIREAYSTIITNNLNRIIKLLTSLTVLLAIPTMISSLYGMNVILPFQDNPYAFTGIVVSSVLISTVLIVLFIKKDWI